MTLPSKKIVISAIATTIIIVGGGAYLYKSHKSSTTKSSSGQYDPNYFNTDSNASKSDSGTNQGGGITNAPSNPDGKDMGSQGSSISQDVVPNKPVGTFVSNHRPNLSGKPAPNTESSTCSTTAGTQCIISFTNGNTVKSLVVKTADSYGNTSWIWKLQDVGLTGGTWTVKATASNGSHKVISTDVNKLIISP